MTHCIIPGCETTVNPDQAIYCRKCGAKLLLQDRYRAIKPLGKGGFGRTFLAVDTQIPSHPVCVIKQLLFNSQDTKHYEAASRLFAQEAVRLEQLGEHPQIPRLLAYFSEGEKMYLVQEYIPGLTLRQELQENGVFNGEKIWELLKELLPVLKFIHDRNVVHRDIKPDNLMRRVLHPLNYDQNLTIAPPKELLNKIVLIDFGVAKLLTGTALIQTGTIVGSAEYMAPEQTRGKSLPASDLFSLGVTCLYLLTGISPWDMYDMVDDKWQWVNFLPQGTKVSDRLTYILNKLLQHSVSSRYHSVDQVLEDMKLTKPLNISPSQLAIPAQKTDNFSNLIVAVRKSIEQIIPSFATPLIDDLYSDVGVDYQKLQKLLATGKWAAADMETWVVLCAALKKENKTYLFQDDIENLPGLDLNTIDKLWVKYSHGKFGFSVQKEIYENVDRDYGKFCSQVGWLTYNLHDRPQGFQYKLSSPKGHLPSRIWSGGLKWSTHAEAMANKLVSS